MSLQMVTSGKIVHANAMMEQDYFLAWGDFGSNYPDPWDNVIPPATSTLHTMTVTKGAAGGLDDLAHDSISKIVLIRDNNQVEFVEGVDFYLDSNQVNWSLAGAEPTTATVYTIIYRYETEDVSTLVHEVGRRKHSTRSYVIPDSNGMIQANGQRWTSVQYETKHICITFRFEGDEAIGIDISQIMLFINTEVDPALPPGQMYFIPSQIVDPGNAYMAENLDPFPRNVGKREQFEVVITY